MNELEMAIDKTKNYARKYGQILSDEQLFLRLISPKIYKFADIKGGQEIIRNGQEWENKLSKAIKLVKEHLIKMKGILMVGVSGSVAAETASKNEDIDMVIITKEDEVWWWRLFLRVYVWYYKIPHRHFGKKEKRDEFCFNLWLDRNNLQIPVEKRNLKNAVDLIMMKVIMDKEGTYQKFLRKNRWVKKYLATGYKKRRLETRDEILDLRRKKNDYSIKKIFNKILFWGQYLYMKLINKQKPKKYDINLGQAFFHKVD